jgi:hypothetical protein
MIGPIRLIRVVAFCAIALASASAQNQNLAVTRHKAEAGDPIAQFDLARAYIAGEGIAKDSAQGLRWLRKSADQNYFGAEYALGIMYQTGAEGLPKDGHEAAKWYVKAARQQNKASQDRLLDMVAKGLISAHEANWRAPEPTKEADKGKPAATDKGKPAPFSVAEVETGLKGWITTKRMATLVQQFGVDFPLSDATRKRLADAGADPVLLQVISTSKRSL